MSTLTSRITKKDLEGLTASHRTWVAPVTLHQIEADIGRLLQMDNIWQKPGHAENVLELWRAIESWINNTTVTLLLFGILIAYIIWLFVAGKIETGVRDDIRHGLHQVLHLRSLADRPEKNRHPARRRLILGEPRGPLRYRPNEMEHEERF